MQICIPLPVAPAMQWIKQKLHNLIKTPAFALQAQDTGPLNLQVNEPHVMPVHANVQLNMKPMIHIGAGLEQKTPQRQKNLLGNQVPSKDNHPKSETLPIDMHPMKAAKTSNETAVANHSTPVPVAVRRNRKIVLKNYSSRRNQKYTAIFLQFCAADYRKMAEEYHQIWLANRMEGEDLTHDQKPLVQSPQHSEDTSKYTNTGLYEAQGIKPPSDINMLAPNMAFKAEGQMKNDAILGPANVLKGSLQGKADEKGAVNMHGSLLLSKELRDEPGNIAPGTMNKGGDDTGKQIVKGNISTKSSESSVSPEEKKENTNKELRTTVKPLSQLPGNEPCTTGNPVSSLNKQLDSEKYSQNTSKTKPVETNANQPLVDKKQQTVQSTSTSAKHTTETTTLGYLETALMVFAINGTTEENHADSHQNVEVMDDSHEVNNGHPKETENPNSQPTSAYQNQRLQNGDSGEREANPEPPEENNYNSTTENYSKGSGEQIHEGARDIENSQENTASPETQPEPQVANVSEETTALEGGTTCPQQSPGVSTDNSDGVTEGNGSPEETNGSPSAGQNGGPEEYSQPPEIIPKSTEPVPPEDQPQSTERNNVNPKDNTGNPESEPAPQENQPIERNESSPQYEGTTESNAGDNANDEAAGAPYDTEQNGNTGNPQLNTEIPELNAESTENPVSQATESNSAGQPDDSNPKENEGEASGQTPPEGSVTDYTPIYGVSYSQEPQPEPPSVTDTEHNTEEAQPQDNQDAQSTESSERSEGVQTTERPQNEEVTTPGSEAQGNEEGATYVKAKTQSDDNENEQNAQDNGASDNGSTQTADVQTDQSYQVPSDSEQGIGISYTPHETTTPAESGEANPEISFVKKTSLENSAAQTEKPASQENEEEQHVNSTSTPEKTNPNSGSEENETDHTKRGPIDESSKHVTTEEYSVEDKSNKSGELKRHNENETYVRLNTETATKPSTQKYELIKLIPHASTHHSSNENTTRHATKKTEFESPTTKICYNHSVTNEPETTEHELKVPEKTEKPTNEHLNSETVLKKTNAEEITTVLFSTTTKTQPVGILQPLKAQPEQKQKDVNKGEVPSAPVTTTTSRNETHVPMESSEKALPEPLTEVLSEKAEPKTSTEEKGSDQNNPNIPVLSNVVETTRTEATITTPEAAEEINTSASEKEEQPTTPALIGEKNNWLPPHPENQPQKTKNQPPGPQTAQDLVLASSNIQIPANVQSQYNASLKRSPSHTGDNGQGWGLFNSRGKQAAGPQSNNGHYNFFANLFVTQTTTTTPTTTTTTTTPKSVQMRNAPTPQVGGKFKWGWF